MFSGGDGIGWTVTNQVAASLRSRLAELSRTDDTVVHQQGVMWEAYSRGVEMNGRRYVVQFGCDGMHQCVAKLFNDRGQRLAISENSASDGALMADFTDGTGDFSRNENLFAGAIYEATGRRVRAQMDISLHVPF